MGAHWHGGLGPMGLGGLLFLRGMWREHNGQLGLLGVKDTEWGAEKHAEGIFSLTFL